jgi:hypothetical protein
MVLNIPIGGWQAIIDKKRRNKSTRVSRLPRLRLTIEESAVRRFFFSRYIRQDRMTRRSQALLEVAQGRAVVARFVKLHLENFEISYNL